MSKNILKKLLGTENAETTNETTVDTDALGEGTVISAETAAYVKQLESDAARKEDPAGWAAEQLSNYVLSPGAQSLLDRAIDNVARNTGVGLNDEDAKADARMRGEILTAAGNNLGVAIAALSSEADGDEAASIVHSLCFNVLKSAVFIGNLDYRRFLDPAQDNDLHLYMREYDARKGEDGRDPRTDPAFETDNRQDHSPLEGDTGFETGAEYQLASLRTLYGDIHAEEDVVAASLQDLRFHFQLLTESFGWPVDRPMPFANVMEPDGTFTPITDAGMALDATELRRQASRAKKRARQGALVNAAAARAREMLLKAAGRKQQ